MKTAILIDDNIAALELLEEALHEVAPWLGCVSLIFSDEALFLIEQELKICPQFIFLNMEVRSKSGVNCLARLNHNANLTDCTIVIFSKVLPPPLAEVLKGLGADFAFQTPSSRFQYKELVSQVLQQRAIEHK